MRKHFVLITMVICAFFLLSCEDVEPVPSAMQTDVYRSYYKPSEKLLGIEFEINFKPKKIRCDWVVDGKVTHSQPISSFQLGEKHTLEVPFDSLNATTPCVVYGVIKITTFGDEKLEVPSRGIQIGYLEGSPFNVSGLLAYWPLKENFDDYSYSYFHLDNKGDFDFLPIPKTSMQGGYFTGENYLTIDHHKSLNPQELSISAYLYIDTLVDGANLYTVISKREYDGWGNSFDLRLAKRTPNGYEISVSWKIKGVQSEFETKLDLPFGEPIHAVYVHNASEVQLWVNGALANQRTSPGLLPNKNTLPICIGTRPGIRHSYRGFIRDVAIWNTSLDSFQINQISALYD